MHDYLPAPRLLSAVTLTPAGVSDAKERAAPFAIRPPLCHVQ